VGTGRLIHFRPPVRTGGLVELHLRLRRGPAPGKNQK
jgi:hypothetical protein